MLAAFVFLSAIIATYIYATDSNRLCALAEGYMSDLLGSRVSVTSASLSIFEGLELHGVNIYVDDGRQIDSLLLSAQSFTVKFETTHLLRGDLDGLRIIAQKPHVHLVQNAQTQQWNFYRVGSQRPKPPTRPSNQPSPSEFPPLPGLLLRNARVEIAELKDGQLHNVGYMAMDGQISPFTRRGKFAFDVQTRGNQGIGPWANGSVTLGSNIVDGELHDLDLTRDVVALLWKEPRVFFESHKVGARIDTLRLHFEPGATPDKFQGRMELHLDDVNFTVQPQDYFSGNEIRRHDELVSGMAPMRRLYRMAGFVAPAQPDAPAASTYLTYKPNAPGNIVLAPASTRPASDSESPTAHVVADVEQAPADPRSPADMVALLTMPGPIKLESGSGTFIFTDSGISLKDVKGRVEGNALLINGDIKGYYPDAPFNIRIRSLNNEVLQIPLNPRYLNSLPAQVREIYTAIRPNGVCTMRLDLDRPTAGSRLFMDGQVDIVDGVFGSDYFPYLLRDVRGQIRFGYDAASNSDFVHIRGIRGLGAPDGPNRDGVVEINGDIGPLAIDIPDPRVEVHVVGKSVYSEPTLMRSLPPVVREPLKIFDADKTGVFPTFHGSFATTIFHKAGWGFRWTFDTDLNLDDAAGKLVGFPYPVDHMAAVIKVRDGFVDVENAHLTKKDASLRVDGRVTWDPNPEDSHPLTDPIIDMKVAAKNVPIDQDLLAALPEDQAAWIKRLGISGKLDVNGRVFQGIAHPAHPATPIVTNRVQFDIQTHVHDGTFWPSDGTMSVSSLSGTLHLTDEGMEIASASGLRSGSKVSAEGAIFWGDGPVQVALHVFGAMPTDGALYSMLPPAARQAWDGVQPRGLLGFDVTYRDTVDPALASDQPSTQPSSRPASQPTSIVSATAPASQPTSTALARFPLMEQIRPGFHGVLTPQKMQIRLKQLPYSLSDVEGRILIEPDTTTIENFTARHGSCRVIASGQGDNAENGAWNLRVKATDLLIDDEFRKAMPATLASMSKSMKMGGVVDIDLPRFRYSTRTTSPSTQPSNAAIAVSRPSAASSPASRGATTAPSPAVDIDLATTVTFKGCEMDLGVPVHNIRGKIDLATAVRSGDIAALRAIFSASELDAANKHMSDISFEMTKPLDRQELNFENIRAKLAGGQVAGDAHLSYPDEGQSKYLLNLVLRNGDLQTLVSDAEKDIHGELTASLTMEGAWGDSPERRGRGDVVVTGKQLYHLPFVLGLFQITNLSLPIATPFKTGGARYSIEGQRVNFERIELKSDNMLMSGAGNMDFKTKRVDLTFSTDNPRAIQAPVINDLLGGMRGELLKIHVKGSINEPKVQAGSFGTFTTTIDEVFRADKSH